MPSEAFRADERSQHHGKRFVQSLVGIVSKPPEILQQKCREWRGCNGREQQDFKLPAILPSRKIVL
jgi:hypothetical protein